MIINVHNLTKTYNGVNVVDNINFAVDSGEIFGFLGKNGAGKSTTIGMLTGITIPTSGSISILDLPYEKIDLVKDKIGVLPDIVNYYPKLTLLEHLNYYSALKRLDYKREDILNIIEMVGLKDNENKKVGKFSFGMKKKLGIAQAILGSPELIFLDEPTSGLDPQSTIEIQNIILALAKEKHTFFLTSHNLSEVEKICTKITIMDKGKIICSGNLNELRNKYQANIVIEIKLRDEKEENIKLFVNSIKDKVIDISITYNTILVSITKDSIIPELVRIAGSQGLNIYNIQTKQLSLEQIYFQTGDE